MNALTKVAALVAVFSAPAAFAQEYPSTPAQPSARTVDYAKFDIDGNGMVSKNEASADATLTAEFSKLDKDKDGSLSATELSAAKTKEK